MSKMNCNGKLLDLSSPVVMGILNITPDSFYDGGKYPTAGNALIQAERMISEGAAIIDVGAVSTRPDAVEIDEKEEWSRLKAVLPALRKKFPETIISVDTWRSSVAREAVACGADMINDISGGRFDQEMFKTVADLEIAYIMMHTQGTPAAMQLNPQYDDVVEDVFDFFAENLGRLNKMGVVKNIIIDPGFGFGKTAKHNYELLSMLSKFKSFGFPVLAGLSRKSMIYKILGTKPSEALTGTTVLNTIALLNGADILRVHDVREAVEAIKLVGFYQNNNQKSDI
jgi:dihydropteroate synthase